jgi:predicted CXXCH cytochrome family protein
MGRWVPVGTCLVLGLALALAASAQPRGGSAKPAQATAEPTPGPAAKGAPSGGSSCTTGGCHTQMGADRYVHGPVVVGACKACHTPKPNVAHPSKAKDSEGDFEFVAQGADLCYTCHERKNVLPVVHGPVQWGQCSFCHDPHQSPNRFRLKETPVSKLCFKCHKDDKTTSKEVHGPVALGECTACHDPHQGKDKVRLTAQGNALCLGCHEERKQEFATRKFSHKPARENCNGCHDPHTSDNPARTRKPVPELCFSCHEAQGKHVAGARTQHDAYKIEKKCLNCHDPHTADQPKQLRAVAAQLCLGCHDKELETPTGKIMNMKAWLADNPVIHGPIRQGDCPACHNPHGSDNFRILRRAYPPQFYAPFSTEQYALCFGCHEPTLALEATTVKLTNFRNGEKNLHFVHVNRPDKGRTCRACHETHASKRPKQIRESVSFGRWDVPTNYEKSDTGGRCTPGCHVSRGSDRVTAVVNK